MASRNARRRRSGPLKRTLSLIVSMLVAAVLLFAIVKLYRPGRTNYPVEYVDIITERAEENSVPAPFIAAVIMAESSYRPNAVSSVGARGLMQIMPDTGEWIAWRLGEEFDPESLYLPETAIRYGAWYLGFLMDRYDGDMRLAAAAYHAGQGTVDKWLADPELSKDGVTLDKIGSPTTDTYVTRVLKYYDYYKEAYENIDRP